MFEPLTLHDYAYANGNPVNVRDPSGTMGLGDVSFGQGAMTNLATRVVSLLNVIDRVQSALGFLQLLSAAQQVFGSGTVFTEDHASRSVGLSGVDFKAAAQSAAINLPKAIATGMGDWSRGYARTAQRSKVTGALIYAPIVGPGAGGAAAIGTPARISFGKEKVPIKIVFGGPAGAAGQLSGIGLEMGSLRQLVRMDYHKASPGHGGATGLKSGEIAVWSDGPFHYHVRKWDQ